MWQDGDVRCICENQIRRLTVNHKFIFCFSNNSNSRLLCGHICAYLSSWITSLSYLERSKEERWCLRRQAGEKKEGEDLKFKLHADIFISCLVFLRAGLAAAANAGFQFSKHLGVPDLPCQLNVCKKREAERDMLHRSKGEGGKYVELVKTEWKVASSGIYRIIIPSTEDLVTTCKTCTTCWFSIGKDIIDATVFFPKP